MGTTGTLFLYENNENYMYLYEMFIIIWIQFNVYIIFPWRFTLNDVFQNPLPVFKGVEIATVLLMRTHHMLCPASHRCAMIRTPLCSILKGNMIAMLKVETGRVVHEKNSFYKSSINVFSLCYYYLPSNKT